MDHCQHIILFTSWFLWTFLLDIRLILMHKHKKMSNTTSYLNLPWCSVKWSGERLAIIMITLLALIRKDILIIRMLMTEFGINFVLELFLNLAPKFMVLRSWPLKLKVTMVWSRARRLLSPEAVTGETNLCEHCRVAVYFCVWWFQGMRNTDISSDLLPF